MKKMRPMKAKALALAIKTWGVGGVFTRANLVQVMEKAGIDKHDYVFLTYRVPGNLVGRGEYVVPDANGEYDGAAPKAAKRERVKAIPGGPLDASVAPAAEMAVVPMIRPQAPKFNPNAHSEYDHAVVPARDPFYVAFGEFKDIQTIVESGQFFPIFISGLSGNGKTFMVEQVCAKAKRSMVRVQMSRETDEDDLIGGFRLVNGETKFMKGPALRAMETGALLLIDEADRADAGKIMCLQGILEGKPYYVKKTGEIVRPVHGFNVIVTANTKGKGSDDGRYVAAAVLDDAWLERFPITIEQDYPKAVVEKKILEGYLCHDKTCSTEDYSFVEHLIAWAQVTRSAFEEGAVDEVITTRRLVFIIQTYRMFGDRMKAISLCINRFNAETKNSLLELYTKVDPTINPAPETLATGAPSTTSPI